MSLISADISHFGPSIADLSLYEDSLLSSVLEDTATLGIVDRDLEERPNDELEILSLSAPAEKSFEPAAGSDSMCAENPFFLPEQRRTVDDIIDCSITLRPKTSRGPQDRSEVSEMAIQPDIHSFPTIATSQTLSPVIAFKQKLARDFISTLLESTVTNLTLMETGGNAIRIPPSPIGIASLCAPNEELILSKYRRPSISRFMRRKILHPDSGRVNANSRHISEWLFYPPHPLNTGPNKRLHRYVASAYDKQLLVHPSLYGFCVRWGGDNDIITESRYIHPIFHGYRLNKVELNEETKEQTRVNLIPRRKVNPYKFKSSISKVLWTPALFH